MRKKRWIWIVVVAVAAAGALAATRGKDKTDPKAENSPFRLGKVQAEDLQVSVREVGVVDPVTKVDVKSALSGKVSELPMREGDTVKKGQLLAAIEPDVNQAQTLAAVRRGVNQEEIEFSDAEKDYLAKLELLKAGLLSQDIFRTAPLSAPTAGLCVAASAGVFLAAEAGKYFRRLADGRAGE